MELTTQYKIATTAEEFEQVYRLTYRTFVEEIPQHAPNADGRHIDKFHAENTYVIGVREGRVIAQLAVRRRRPFSLDAKLPDLDRWLPAGQKPVELRLLAVDPAHRNGPVAARLLKFAGQYCLERGDNMAVISGALRQLRLYRALGFEAFGPVVGTEAAPYQPMYLTLERYARASTARAGLNAADAEEAVGADGGTLNLLPGPVSVSPAALRRAGRTPLSHRSPEFAEVLANIRRRLAALVHANDVQVMPGSGSLANDVIAAQLSGLRAPGVVLSSGEFGERIADQARRAGLKFHCAQLPWGTVLTRELVTRAIVAQPGARWLWLVHHETSTGIIHDLAMVKAIARQHGLALCLDCISSIGAVDVDLSGVHLASGVSGKGIGGLPGLALVFHEQPVAPRSDLPRYLDLGLWAANGSIPFTHSSNLVGALDVALAEVERLPAGRCGSNDDAAWFRAALREAGYHVVGDEAHLSPVIVTIELPSPLEAGRIGAELEHRGYLASHRSGYLTERNWIQFCLISQPSRAALTSLIGVLDELTGLVPAQARASA